MSYCPNNEPPIFEWLDEDELVRIKGADNYSTSLQETCQGVRYRVGYRIGNAPNLYNTTRGQFKCSYYNVNTFGNFSDGGNVRRVWGQILDWRLNRDREGTCIDNGFSPDPLKGVFVQGKNQIQVLCYGSAEQVPGGTSDTYYPPTTQPVWLTIFDGRGIFDYPGVLMKPENVLGLQYTPAPNADCVPKCSLKFFKLGQVVLEKEYDECPQVEVICADEEQEECPPNTCSLDCGSHICCYNSQGIAVKSISK